MQTESLTRRIARPCSKIRFGTLRRSCAGTINGTKINHRTRSRRRLLDRPMALTDRRRPHPQQMGRRLLSFPCTKNPLQPRCVVSQTRCQVDKIFAGGCRSLAKRRVDMYQKKGIIFLIPQTVFAFSPESVGELRFGQFSKCVI